MSSLFYISSMTKALKLNISLTERPNLDCLNSGSSSIQSAGLSNQQCQPRYFVGLARLQLTNLPDAADLTPHRNYEFTLRLSRDCKITFCDHRVSNVFAPSAVTPANIIGKLFTELIVGVDGLASFSICFEKGKLSLVLLISYIGFYIKHFGYKLNFIYVEEPLIK